MTRGGEAAPSGLPLVIGTVSLADRPEAHEAYGTGDKGGKKPPPPPPAGPPPGIPTVVMCLLGATEEGVDAHRPLLVAVSSSLVILSVVHRTWSPLTSYR